MMTAMPRTSVERRRLNARLLGWFAVKNAMYPFRGVISGYLRRRHVRFDRKLGICTIGSATSDEIDSSRASSVRQGVPINFFRSILASLHLDYSTTVFVDLGCGKGRTLIQASGYPFRSIIGVEMSEALCQIAVANVKQYRSKHLGTPEISVVCNQIGEFEYDGCEAADHLLVCIHSRCTVPIFRAALHNLARSA